MVRKFNYLRFFSFPDCRGIPLRATLISTLLWTFSCLIGLFFAIRTTEISPLNKAMCIYFNAHFTILLRHPCVSMFSFRANAEVRRLDMKEERERRRNIVIQEAAKERAARKENSTNNHIEIQLQSSDHPNYPQYPNSTQTYQDATQINPDFTQTNPTQPQPIKTPAKPNLNLQGVNPKSKPRNDKVGN